MPGYCRSDQARPDGATGCRKRRFPGSRLIRYLVTLLLFLSVISGPVIVWAIHQVVVFNDSVSLETDFTVGRFGTGKLYFDDPVDVAVGEDEDVYILDSGNYRVQVMDDEGDYLREWRTAIPGVKRQDEPVAIAYSQKDESVYVLVQDPPAVNKYDLEGNLLLSFGERGLRKGTMKEPVDITVDALGYVYVLDRERYRVLKFHKSGEFVDEWGDRGRRNKDFNQPVSLAYSDELTGRVYVLDIGRKELLQFQRDGNFRGAVAIPPQVFAEGSNMVKLESDGGDNLFVLDAGMGKLIKFGSDRISVFMLRSEEVELDRVIGLVIDPDDNIYVSDLRKNRVYRFPLEAD